MIELKTASELDAMRSAGRVVAEVLAALREHARVGVPLRELDDVATTILTEAGAEPVLPGTRPNREPRPFPGVLCLSVNDTIGRAPPTGVRLSDGDLLSIDCGARVEGRCGGAAVTIPVGTARPDDRTLLATTEAALADGIAACRIGARLGDVSHAIGLVGRSSGYGIPGRLGGHGIGRDRDEAPFVANDGAPGRGSPLRPGMVLSLEPMFVAGGRDSYQHDHDGWALRTDDGSRCAHAAHTVTITDDGPRVLTVP